ncbi:secreted protein containing PKD domain protein [Candidatus Magnetomorum sp. HK-1]|nr:secreted protein containing PKD domain protein [Candidatus Magnetomorum sp. HK-1]
MKSYIKDIFCRKNQLQPIGLKHWTVLTLLLCGMMITGLFNSATASVPQNPTIEQHSFSDYVPGGLVQMSCVIKNTHELSAIGVKVQLPQGWMYELQSMSGPNLPENDKATEDGVEFFWTQIPQNSQIEFNYMLRSSIDVSSQQTIDAKLLYRVNDEEESTVPANPVKVQQVVVNGFHYLSDFIDEKTCTIDNILFYDADLTALGIRLSIPEKMDFSDPDNAKYRFKYIDDSTVEIFWETPPESPVNFSYLLTRTGAISVDADIETKVFYRISDGQEREKNIYPDPLSFPVDDHFTIHASTSGEGGTIDPEGEIQVSRGENVLFSYETEDGYKFSGWLVDGTIDHNAPFYKYVFKNVIDDHFIKALFERIEYQITINKGPNGKIVSNTGDNNVFHGDDIEFTIIPDEGYEIDEVRVNGADYFPDDNQVLFNNVIDNQQRLVVTFKPKQYEIIVSSGENGQVTNQDNNNFVLHGHDKTYILKPDKDYVIGTVKVNGQDIVLNDNTYTFRNVIHSENSLFVTFVPISDYVITAITEGDGKINPQGEISVKHGQDSTFKFTPDKNNIIKDVIIDGISYGPLNNYLFKYVTENHTIKAVFAQKEQFMISVNAGEGGTISPGDVTVFKGDHQSFKITASTGYMIKDVQVDGESKGVIQSYTFWNVQKNYDLVAEFETINNVFTVSITHTIGGTVDPSGTIEVNQGKNLLINNKPYFGYAVEDVIVNEESNGPLSKLILTNIKKHYTVEIKFKLVATKPEASILMIPNSGFAPLKVLFSNQSNDFIDQWLWSFGDGEKSADKNPIHTYSNPGEYTVSLMVSGPGGTDTQKITQAVEVHQIEPVKVLFIAKKTRGIAPLDVEFINMTQGDVTSWLWDFGDGVTSTEKNPMHVYTQTGNYTVTLIADDSYSSQKSDYIKISGRTIRGQILAGDIDGNDTGNSLEGYTVEVHRRLGSTLIPLFIANTLSDENGYYTLVDLPSTNNLLISVWPPYDDNQYQGEYYNNKTNAFTANSLSTEDTSLTGIDFVLKKIPALGIKGQVTKANMGQASIEVNAFSVSKFIYQTTLTDSEGFYTFTNLLEANDYRIYVWSEAHQSEIYFHLHKDSNVGVDIPTFSVLTWDMARTVTPSDPAIEKIDIIMDEEQTQMGNIQGLVRLKEGAQPIKGLWVNAWSDTLNTGNGAVTDASGAYTIVGLLMPENLDDAYIVEIDSSNDQYPYQAYEQADKRSFAKKVMPDSQGINFYLKTGNTMYGNVSDNEGSPLANVKVQTWSISKESNNSTTTDAAGMYSLPNLPPSDDYVVAAFSDNYPVQYFFHKEKRKNADYVDLTDGNVYNIDFSLDEGAVIEGTVYIQNTQTPAGEGIFVNVWSNTTERLHTEKTDANSQYRFVGLDPDATDYIIYIWEPDYLKSYYSSSAENNTVYRWSEATGVQPSTALSPKAHNIVLFSGVEIRGKITYEGKAVANVKVEAWDPENDVFVDDVSTSSVSKGYNYKLTGLGPGTYKVSVYHDAFADIEKTIEITNDDITNADFILQTHARSISGTIIGLEQGKELFVKATRKNTTYTKMIKVLGTGNNVDYIISGLEPLKKYIVDIIPTAQYPYIAYDAKTKMKDATLIDLRNDDAEGIDLQLFTETVSISGIITFPEYAIKNDFVWIYAVSAKMNAESQTKVIYKNDLTVPYEIEGLRPSDDYVVSLSSNIYKQQFFDNADTFDQAARINTTDSSPDDSINFELTMGTYIEGIVYAENGKGKANVRVEAWSENAESFGYFTTLSNGAYRIGGLKKTDDYVIYVSYNNTVLYYHSDGVVYDIEKATQVSTRQINPDNIDFNLIKTESISGTVKDSKGRRLENVTVSAWSVSTGAGNGCKTNKKGYFEITALPPGDDYQISVTPDTDMLYIGQIKSDVKTGTRNEDFVLMIGRSMTGKVQSWHGEAVPDVVIELSSKDGLQQYKSITDSDGFYEINGIPEDRGYYLYVNAPEQSKLVDFFEKGILIDNDYEKNITLASASQIDGQIVVTDPSTLSGQRPASMVMVTLLSPENSFWTFTLTDKNGYYVFTNIPNASDYIIKSVSDEYSDHVEIDRSSGETVNFKIDPAIIIQGTVLNGETGAGIDGAIIEVYYKTDQVRKIARTNENGKFLASGLETMINGETVKEFILVAKYKGYPDTEAIWKVGQSDGLTIKMARSEQNVIKGTVTDVNLAAPPEDVAVYVRIYNYQRKGGLLQIIKCDSDGSFKFEGLSTSGRYQIKFVAINSDLASSKLWIGDDNPNINRSGASIVQTHDGEIEFKFLQAWTTD